MRLAGASYEEIARAGGGIVSTMRATRAADEDALVAAALPRLDALIAEGATTVEIKSGYGLSLEHEIKCLRAARRLATKRPARIVTESSASSLPASVACSGSTRSASSPASLSRRTSGRPSSAARSF